PSASPPSWRERPPALAPGPRGRGLPAGFVLAPGREQGREGAGPAAPAFQPPGAWAVAGSRRPGASAAAARGGARGGAPSDRPGRLAPEQGDVVGGHVPPVALPGAQARRAGLDDDDPDVGGLRVRELSPDGRAAVPYVADHVAAGERRGPARKDNVDLGGLVV